MLSMSVLTFIDRWLPPPRALRLGGLGIDISESSIKYIGFQPNYAGLSNLSLTHWGEASLPAGTLEHGEIRDLPGLTTALAEVRRRTGETYARLSLPEERVYLFETELERDIAAGDIPSLLEFRLEENVPISSRDAYFDYRLSPGDAPGSLLASVTVSARAIVDAYHEACLRAGITPLSFEVESQAIARAALPEGGRGTKLLVDFGQTRTGIGIVHHGVLLYTSTVEIGGAELSSALRRHLGDKDEAELTRIKNEAGLVRGAAAPAQDEALLPLISALKDEIQLRISYWHDKHGAARAIDEVILCGGSANLRGLTDYLSETLGIEAVLADVWQNVLDTKLTTPPIDRRHAYGYATAIGLALAPFTDDL